MFAVAVGLSRRDTGTATATLSKLQKVLRWRPFSSLPDGSYLPVDSRSQLPPPRQSPSSLYRRPTPHRWLSVPPVKRQTRSPGPVCPTWCRTPLRSGRLRPPAASPRSTASPARAPTPVNASASPRNNRPKDPNRFRVPRSVPAPSTTRTRRPRRSWRLGLFRVYRSVTVPVPHLVRRRQDRNLSRHILSELSERMQIPLSFHRIHPTTWSIT
jgi:hypothetical protein